MSALTCFARVPLSAFTSCEGPFSTLSGFDVSIICAMHAARGSITLIWYMGSPIKERCKIVAKDISGAMNEW